MKPCRLQPLGHNAEYYWTGIRHGYGPGGGRGTQQLFILGGCAPRFNPLPFCIPFFFTKKGTPFVYLLLTNGTLSHTLYRTKRGSSLVRTLYPFLPLSMHGLLNSYRSPKKNLLALLGPSTDPIDRFSYPFVYCNE